MESELLNDIVSAAKAVRTESEMLSDLLSRGEVLSDHTLAAHYQKRLAAMEPVLVALKAFEERGTDAAADALRAELVLHKLQDQDAPLYAGAGVCVRAFINKEQVSYFDFLNDLVRKAGLTVAVKERSETFFRAELGGQKAYSLLCSLQSGAMGEGARFAVYPVIAAPDFREEDVRTDIFLNGGKGGQNVNKVETAVRMVHVPTGVTVTCRTERSQLQNKKKALRALQARVKEYYQDAQNALIARAKASLGK